MKKDKSVDKVNEEEEKKDESTVKTNETVEEVVEAEENVETEENLEEKLQEELDKMEDQFLRAQAEIANMRNRHKKEREEASRYRAQELAKELLPALDNLDRALAIEVSDEHGEAMKKGIEMVRESMLHAFKESGIEEIKAQGEVFDPNLHQAVQTVPAEDGQDSDVIVQVLQKGYILHDRVLRPSMVIVTQ
ncbi:MULTISPECIES: nucleotide exchange factor GrpE [Vagococcus]|uniref:nucleotide exchange factor GrpE n=1 Tax=Vagococcus TaxID=2737 RepID=UPI0008F8857C|nr:MULTISPECIES: nucleotide exchange factor GrpE [Vagococcus]RHH69572.1 nucleotide exchange factor GrpE [Vagococcus sp. AM17-17]